MVLAAVHAVHSVRKVPATDLLLASVHCLQAFCIQHLSVVAKGPRASVTHHLRTNPRHVSLVLLDVVHLALLSKVALVFQLVAQGNCLLIQAVEDSSTARKRQKYSSVL